MIDFSYLRKYMEDKLNSYLTQQERETEPFILYADIGDMVAAYRNLNTVIMPRFGLIRLTSSEITPLGTLTVQEITATVEVVVNVDRMSLTENNVSEYRPVARVREVFDALAEAETGQVQLITVQEDADTSTVYSVVPVYTLSNAGNFIQTTTEMGKIVPMSFRVTFTIIDNGINSDDVSYSLDGQTLYCLEASETMTSSTEGQTHENDVLTVNSIQEAKYGADLQIVMTDSNICRELVRLMHQGIDNEIHTLTVSYNFHNIPQSIYSKNVLITQISQSVKRPINVILSVSFIDADELLEEE